jgi:hypothetical protein
MLDPMVLFVLIMKRRGHDPGTPVPLNSDHRLLASLEFMTTHD